METGFDFLHLQLNHVFDHLEVMRHFNGPVLFLEEDHYVVDDAIVVIKQMYRMKSRSVETKRGKLICHCVQYLILLTLPHFVK